MARAVVVVGSGGVQLLICVVVWFEFSRTLTLDANQARARCLRKHHRAFFNIRSAIAPASAQAELNVSSC
jgi:hypothetical protein